MTQNPRIDRLREICLAFPEANERLTWEQLTFRVREKIFAMANPDPAETNLWLKSGPGVQEVLVAADSSRFYRPPYVGPKGWIGIHLFDPIDWGEVGDLIDASYRLVAPKKLVAQLPANL
jgi:predicted DNA-binding protein (MmcQ/YjbR family)